MLEKHSQAEAEASKSLTNGTSPFITGAKFKITGHCYEQVDDKSAFYPCFVTSLGTLSVQSLLRAKAVKPYERDGEMIFSRQPTGTFHDFLRKFLAENRGKTNEEVLTLLDKEVSKMQFVVRQREYVTVETKYGDRAQPLCHIDIVRE